MLHHAESGTGPAVVLLHAFPMDATLWAPQRGALAERGFRVITPDLPGFGGSPLSERAPDLDVMADEVADLMAGLGVDEAVVGGLSMGGYVAMAMLRRHRARVSALLLADTRAGADSPEAAANREAVAGSVQAAGSTAQLAEMMLPQLLGTTTLRLRPEVVATGVPEGGYRLLSDADALAYLTGYNPKRQSGRLEVLFLKSGDTFGVDGVTEWQATTWPDRGIIYAVDEGKRAGIWFAAFEWSRTEPQEAGWPAR